MMKIDFEVLEKFLDNDLNPEELRSVKKLITTDGDLANELKLRADVNEAIMEKDIMSLREKLNTIHTDCQKTETVGVRQLITQKWHLAAASITILIMVGSFLFSGLNQTSTDRLYHKYYSSEDAFFTSRSSVGENNQLNIALGKFQNKEFDHAIKLLIPYKDNHMAQFYLGLAYMETEHFSYAKSSFQAILDHKTNIFMEQAKWYKALCLLKLNKKEEAIQLFENIIEDKNLYYEDATNITKKLK